MSHRFSLDQWRALQRPESFLVFLLLVALVAWYYVSGKASDAETELTAVESTLSAAQNDLRYWTNNFDVQILQEELNALQSRPKPPDLPTHREALAFRSNFVAYASQQNLPLSSLEVLEITRDLGDASYPAVRYSMVISGGLTSLVGSLRTIEPFPTASIQGMEFFRPEQGPDIWGLSITLDVLYQPEEVLQGAE